MGVNNGVERTLGKILATQEHIIERFDEFSARLETHIKDDREMEKRLVHIEHRINYATGFIVAMASVFSLLSSYLLRHLGLA